MLTVVIILLRFSLLVGSSQFCSREISRKVRAFTKREIFSELQISPYNLPSICQLNPSNDFFEEQEKFKAQISRADWHCLYCDKHFKSELYLDLHMQNKHEDKISNKSTTCLADLCPALGCHLTDKLYNDAERYSFDRDFESSQNKFHNVEACTPTDIEKNKYKCEVLIDRCFSGLFDRNGVPLDQVFHERICNQVRCVNGLLDIGSTTGAQNTGSMLNVVGCLQIAVSVIIVAGAILYAFINNLGPFRIFAKKTSSSYNFNRKQKQPPSLYHRAAAYFGLNADKKSN